MTLGFDLSPRPGPDVSIGTGSTFDESVSWGRRVSLGRDVHVGPNAVLHDGVVVGDSSWIGPNVVLGEPTFGFYRDRDSYVAAETRIGAHAIVRTGTLVNAGTTVGDHFQSGPHVAIRENVRIGAHVSVGNNGDIQYEAEIGDFTRIHSFVAVGSGSRIGPYCWIHPFVVLTNDRLFPIFTVPEPPVIAPFSVLAVHTTILPGARLGVHVVVGAGSEVSGDVKSFSFLKGSPAERITDARKVVHRVGGKPVQPYPWIRHVDRDYPWSHVPPAERRVEDWVPPEWRDFL